MFSNVPEVVDSTPINGPPLAAFSPAAPVASGTPAITSLSVAPPIGGPPEVPVSVGAGRAGDDPSNPVAGGDVDMDISEEIRTLKMSIDVAILMDCTGSMREWITAAKETSVKTANEVKVAMPNADYRLAFVGYRDFGDLEQYVVSDFTERAEEIEERLGAVTATGGSDAAEDVAGGLRKVLDLSWKATTKVVIHVADAPAHGRAFHEVLLSDRYPKGDPKGLDLLALIRDLSAREIDYTFIKITKDTDTMLLKLAEAYEAARASSEQTFAVLDLQIQPTTASTKASPSSSLGGMAIMRGLLPTITGEALMSEEDEDLTGSSLLKAERGPTPARRSEAVHKSAAPTRAAHAMMSRIAAAPASSAVAIPLSSMEGDAYHGVSAAYADACTTTVLRSVMKRTPAIMKSSK